MTATQHITALAIREPRAAAPRDLRNLEPACLSRLTRTVLELRQDAHLSFPAISVVLARYENVDLSSEQVRDWCRRLGCPVDEWKVRSGQRPESAAAAVKRALAEKGPSTSADLAVVVRRNRRTVSTALCRLEADGVVRRVGRSPSPDWRGGGRVVWVSVDERSAA